MSTSPCNSTQYTHLLFPSILKAREKSLSFHPLPIPSLHSEDYTVLRLLFPLQPPCSVVVVILLVAICGCGHPINNSHGYKIPSLFKRLAPTPSFSLWAWIFIRIRPLKPPSFLHITALSLSFTQQSELSINKRIKSFENSYSLWFSSQLFIIVLNMVIVKNLIVTQRGALSSQKEMFIKS